MAGKLNGKIALVTGGSSGIGLATAKQFIEEGAFVYITGRRQAELDSAAQSLGNQASAVRADASNLSDLDSLYEQIKQDKGRLDVLFVNAGGGSFAPIGQITEEQFHRPEGPASHSGWGCDRSECFDRLCPGHSKL
jgi:NAD(P)-dependent dehydrogenase (short-subunit alcohol dehydrogenase family)